MKKFIPALLSILIIANVAYARWPSKAWQYGPADLSGRDGETVQDGVDDLDRRINALGGETETELVKSPAGSALKLESSTATIEIYTTNSTLQTRITADGWLIHTNSIQQIEGLFFANDAGVKNITVPAGSGAQLNIYGSQDGVNQGNYLRFNANGNIALFGGTNATAEVSIGPLNAAGETIIGNNTDWIIVDQDGIDMRNNGIEQINALNVSSMPTTTNGLVAGDVWVNGASLSVYQ